MFLTVFKEDCILFGNQMADKIFDITMFILLTTGLFLNVGTAGVRNVGELLLL